MKGFRLSLLGCLALVVGIVAAKAELPPTAYEQFQADAPEVFQIKVDQVSSKFPGVFDRSKRIETVQATVVKVVRSKSDTKEGEKITLRYERLIPKDGWAGPSPAPALEKGKEYPAYLSKSADGTFGLGAQGKSFETVTSKPR
jgi:methionine aminopeptidase